MRATFLAALIPIAGFAASAAAAHDFWTNGQEVDPWTKKVCCGEGDAHQLSPDQVHVTKEGYWLADTGETISFDRAQPSPDGRIWAFRWAGATQCFFKPPEGT